MKTLNTLIATLSVGLFSAVAFAQAPADAPKEAPGHHKMHDCSKVQDADKRAKCEMHQDAMKKCKDMKPEDHKKCMHEAMPKKG